jgi:hypothetical protein
MCAWEKVRDWGWELVASISMEGGHIFNFETIENLERTKNSKCDKFIHFKLKIKKQNRTS